MTVVGTTLVTPDKNDISKSEFQVVNTADYNVLYTFSVVYTNKEK